MHFSYSLHFSFRFMPPSSSKTFRKACAGREYCQLIRTTYISIVTRKFTVISVVYTPRILMLVYEIVLVRRISKTTISAATPPPRRRATGKTRTKIFFEKLYCNTSGRRVLNKGVSSVLSILYGRRET